MKVSQTTPLSVLRREEDLLYFFKGPGNTEIGVVPKNPSLVLGSIVIGHLVEDIGNRGEHQEPMSVRRRNVEEIVILLGELYSIPLTESGRVGGDVHGNIEDPPPHDPHQLSLRAIFLEMEPPQHTLTGTGVVVLYKRSGDTQRVKVL